MPANPAIQTEVLRVDFVVNDKAATKAKNDFVAGLKVAGKEIDTFGKNFGKDIATNLATSQRAVDDLIAKIDAAKSRSGQLAPATIANRQAAERDARSADALAVLRGGQTGGRFINQDPNTSAASRAAGRLNLGRQGADVFTTAAMGMDPLMIAIQQGPQAFDAMATSGISLSKSALVTAGVFAGIIAAGYIIVKISQAIKENAEARLKLEEKIQGVHNKQALALKESVDALAAARKERADEAALTERLAGSNQQLEARKKILEDLNELNRLNRTDAGVAARNERSAEIFKIEDELIKRTKDRQTAENEAFEQRNENFKRSQKTQAEEAAAFAKSVDAGVAKINELADANKKLFSELRGGAAGENRFVTVFSEADAAIEKTRLTTAALSKELQGVALGLTEAANANKLFDARLRNALSVSDLRADAERFRGGGSGVPIDPKIFESTDSFNAYALRQFQNLNIAGLGSQANTDSMVSALARLRVSGPVAESTARDRFQRQLDVINQQRPANDEQRAIADRAIIEVGRSLNENELTGRDRDEIAAALERQATRQEKQESEAIRLRAEDRETNKNIDANISKLLKIAETEGLTGTMRIINEAENSVKLSLGKRPNEADTLARSGN